MKKYINTRVIRSICGDRCLVQAQSNRTYNWETLADYPLSQMSEAEADACNKAREFSRNVEGLVTAYNCGGYGIKGFINNEEYTR